MAADILEILLPVYEIDDRGRYGEQGDDPRRGGTDGRQYHNKGDHADDGADDRKVRVQDLDRTMTCLALGVFELFIKFRSVETGKIHLARLVHDSQIYVVDDQLPCDICDDAVYTVHHTHDKGIRETQNEQPHHGGELIDSVCGGNIRGGKAIEQLRADPRADDGGHAVEERHENHEKEDPRSRVPDNVENVDKPVEEFSRHAAYVSGHFPDGLWFRLPERIAGFVLRTSEESSGRRSH